MPRAKHRRARHQHRLVRNRLALLARPRAHAVGVGAAGKIGIRFVFGQPENLPLDAHLPLQFRPKESERGKRMLRQRLPLAAGVIGKKNKTLRVHFFQQHHAISGAVIRTHRCHVHRRRLVYLRRHRLVQPQFKLLNRVRQTLRLG